MEDSKINRISFNIISGIILRIASLIIPFFIRTLIIQRIGIDYLGLSSLFSSLLQVLSLAELGFGSAMVYSMYQPIAVGNRDKVCALLNLYKKIYRIIGLGILVCGLAVLPFIDSLIKGTHPSDINISYIYLVFLFNATIGYYLYAYKSSLLNASQRLDIINYTSLACSLIMYTLQIVIILLLENYYYYIAMIPLLSIANNLIIAWYTKKKYPMYLPSGSLGKEDIRNIRKRVIALFGNRVGGVVTNSADSVVISSFLGLTLLALYNNYYLIIYAVNSVIIMLFNSMTASIGHKMCTSDPENNYEDFNTLLFMNQWIVGWCSVCLLCLIQNFIYLWIGPAYMYPSTVALSFVIYFFMWQIRRTALVYKDAGGFWWEDRIRPIVLAGLNVVLNILWITKIGIYGVLFSTVLVQVISIPWESKVLFKFFNISIRKYIQKIFYYIAITTAVCAITYYLCNFVGETTIRSLLLRSAICCVVPNLLYYAVYRKKHEYKKMKSLVERALNIEKMT